MSLVVGVAAGPAGDVPAIAGISLFTVVRGAPLVVPGVAMVPVLKKAGAYASP